MSFAQSSWFNDRISFRLPSVTFLNQKHTGDDDLGDMGLRIGGGHGHSKPCKACNDFRSWMQWNNLNAKNSIDSENKIKPKDGCPLDKDELGRSSWNLLHTMSVYYPEHPTTEEQSLMKNFIIGLARFYPCESCAKDFQADIKVDPPRTENRIALSEWFCRVHNRVNRKLGKPEFDCSKLYQRWLDGWPDGSCD
ncbi:uncharacterized protein NH340_JMT03998 [Sarcoptes scabiei]|uniref:Sulfhydryl oxidase n=1 Tax=Sarcoptes scabiei TaxID=52283 RepID=A0A132A3F3_SARSC|nr:FAD-linked sulfhydryl oxidase ALR-like protein [Sarcoptes scabiei]UXI18055.1 uncharacterized protein NH340_JMT03998 [Sarcoptes scabiei]